MNTDPYQAKCKSNCYHGGHASDWNHQAGTTEAAVDLHRPPPERHL